MSNVNVQPVQPPYYPPPQPQRSGCLIAVIVVLLLLLGWSVLMNMALLGKSVAGVGPVAGGPRRPSPLAEKWVMGEGAAKVALIELTGVIMDEVSAGGLFGVTERPVMRIRRELEEAAKDGDVKAVIFSVDSPGGTITASDEILHLVKKFKKETGKPVVVRMGALCASGGYYVSAAADSIIAGPTTITGSIGVILQSFNFSKAMETFKVQHLTIKAGANKDLLNPFLPYNEEHIAIVQGMIDDAYDRFVKVVAEGRRLSVEEVQRLADGRIYTASEAVKLNLVDKIGYLEDAVEEAKTLASAPAVTVVRYTRAGGFLAALAGDIEARTSAARPLGVGIGLDALLHLATPRICYLWAPGTAELVGK